eukprot:GHVR01138274.1.p1 GENE.GHVR01138274.1~~GHVR01138274.1.p1  ORF type:complete len:157 (+),score=20.85 GHVR01138274.1:66-536(+)
MQIFVRGLSGKTHVLNVSSNASVIDVKEQISARDQIPCSHQRLICGGKQLDDMADLAHYDIQDESTIYVSASLLGGGKKRKKKQFKTPKKIKHKKKKVKLAVLKFYKVDSNEKVSRLRKECRSKTCGRGVFMANHHNRFYCGRCALTYLIDKPNDE